MSGIVSLNMTEPQWQHKSHDLQSYDTLTVSQHSLGSHHLEICCDQEARPTLSYSNRYYNIVSKGFAGRQYVTRNTCTLVREQQVVSRGVQPLNQEERAEKYDWAKRRGKDRRRGEKRKCTPWVSYQEHYTAAVAAQVINFYTAEDP